MCSRLCNLSRNYLPLKTTQESPHTHTYTHIHTNTHTEYVILIIFAQQSLYPPIRGLQWLLHECYHSIPYRTEVKNSGNFTSTFRTSSMFSPQLSAGRNFVFHVCFLISLLLAFPCFTLLLLSFLPSVVPLYLYCLSYSSIAPFCFSSFREI